MEPCIICAGMPEIGRPDHEPKAHILDLHTDIERIVDGDGETVWSRDISREWRFQCRCLWEGVRCPNEATQEDALCDWCGTRRPEQMANNPKAVFDPDGKFLGLGGAGEVHDAPLVHDADHRIPPGKTAACWYENSGRTVL